MTATGPRVQAGRRLPDQFVVKIRNDIARRAKEAKAVNIRAT
jgi:hypothetical protein